MRFTMICLLLVPAVPRSCERISSQHETVTPLVKKVQDAGAGTLAGVPTKAIERWLSKRPELTREVIAECQRIESTAPAIWGVSTEGILCAAAGDAKITVAQKNFFRYVRPEKDPTRVPPGFGDLAK